MKVLIIACHPDDEILGVGGTIQKHIEQGDSVEVLIVTEAPSPEWSVMYKIGKINEQEKVDKFLGIDKRYFFDLSALTLNTLERGRFNYKFYRIIEAIKPDIIYTHFNKELNEEHNLVSMATLVGARIPNKATIYMYETPSVRYSLTPFKPNYYVELSEVRLGGKRLSFLMYESEVKTSPHPRSVEGIRTLAMYRGNEIGVEYAEAFVQVRRIWMEEKEVHKKGAQGYY